MAMEVINTPKFQHFDPLETNGNKLVFNFEKLLDNSPLNHHPIYNTMCKHWLRGLCKKGFNCEYLHIYDMSKMPYCHFYQRGKLIIQLCFFRIFNLREQTKLMFVIKGECQDPECVFLHKTEEKEECPWYAHIGFCRYGK